jgi:energy-coupling factor transport system permease protein
MFLEYQPGNSLLHRLDVRTKSFGFLLIIIAVFLFSNPLYNLAVFSGCLLLAFSIRMSIQKLKSAFLTLFPILVLIIFLSSFSYHPDSFQKPMSKIVLFSFLPNGHCFHPAYLYYPDR